MFGKTLLFRDFGLGWSATGLTLPSMVEAAGYSANIDPVAFSIYPYDEAGVRIPYPIGGPAVYAAGSAEYLRGGQ
jgi:hypothetical protein